MIRLLNICVLLVFPLFMFALPCSFRYADSFIHFFQQGDCLEGLEILDQWEAVEPAQKNKITGMRAAVYLSTGDLERGALLMDQFIDGLSGEELSDPMMTFALNLYYAGVPGFSIGSIMPRRGHTSMGIATLCKQEQPTGVKLKYWFGVGQILVGILAAPFSGGTSTALILSGTAIVVDATADALNNKENWEKDLRDRQRMDPDLQKNSFCPRSHFQPRQRSKKDNYAWILLHC